jgi:hypothetical protein
MLVAGRTLCVAPPVPTSASCGGSLAVLLLRHRVPIPLPAGRRRGMSGHRHLRWPRQNANAILPTEAARPGRVPRPIRWSRTHHTGRPGLRRIQPRRRAVRTKGGSS